METVWKATGGDGRLVEGGVPGELGSQGELGHWLGRGQKGLALVVLMVPRLPAVQG